MSKYEPLRRHLESLAQDSWEVPFPEIEKVLGFPLPSSAHRHTAWWANESHGSHSHSRSWQDAGWETSGVDLRGKRVCFRRGRKPGRELGNRGTTSSEPGLWARASKLTGITDRDELVREALQALSRRESGKRLIAPGGTMPDAFAAPRERPFA